MFTNLQELGRVAARYGPGVDALPAVLSKLSGSDFAVQASESVNI